MAKMSAGESRESGGISNGIAGESSANKHQTSYQNEKRKKRRNDEKRMKIENEKKMSKQA
jgi:hypothetical protein